MSRGTGEVSVHGCFLEIEPPRKLVYTWQWLGAFPGMPETKVTVEFHAVAGGTEISLRQEALAMPFCVQHLSGWLDALDRITRIVGEPVLLGLVPAGDHAL
jgi:glutathione S-transferase